MHAPEEHLPTLNMHRKHRETQKNPRFELNPGASCIEVTVLTTHLLSHPLRSSFFEYLGVSQVINSQQLSFSKDFQMNLFHVTVPEY